MLLLISLMLLSHVEIDKQNQLLWSSGSSPEKFWYWEDNTQEIENGTKWLIFLLPEMLNQLETNKKKLKSNNKKQGSWTKNQKLNRDNSNPLPFKVKKAGDYSKNSYMILIW